MSDATRTACEELARGAVVAAATESSFGLLVDARNAAALERLFALKGREQRKGVALITPSLEALADFVSDVPELALTLSRRFWPGLLTIALPARESVDARLVVDGTVGARVPGPSAASELVRAYGAPLTATSANLAGEPPLLSDEAVRRTLVTRDAALFVVPGTAPGGPPSTVVKVGPEGWTIARAGAITHAAIASALTSISER